MEIAQRKSCLCHGQHGYHRKGFKRYYATAATTTEMRTYSVLVLSLHILSRIKLTITPESTYTLDTAPVFTALKALVVLVLVEV